MSSEDLSRITLWRINNGYVEDASNQAATIFNQQSLQKRKLVCIVKKDKNRSLLLYKIAGSIEA
jgi:hypothetical protein